MPETSSYFCNLKPTGKTFDEELPTPDIAMNYDDREGTQQTIEAEQELFEENYRSAWERRWKGQERWQGRRNAEMRVVNIMHPYTIIEKLKATGVDASIEPAVLWVWEADDKTGILGLHPKARSTARIWLNDFVVYKKGTQNTHAGRIGVNAWVNEGERRWPRCITSLQWDCGPEWSLMYFDQWDVPTQERYRGWRTALLALITHDVLTEAEVDKAFGPVVENEASELYRDTLQQFRNRTQH